CGSPGAKGGNGGNLLYSDGVERQNFDILSGFNGGTGGAGTPPGAGGSGGRDNDGKKIGSNGSQGATC
ncbi:MAG: PE family protein, partial [Candidatus Eremiobacteraeota bacterium]|nr:PE family protein [Candidatus Eremiobacteraeota bacterium]